MPDRRIRYSLDDEKRFVVEDYNWAIPFSNFFPGIAGLWGIPLWVYYVSRGQAVCSVGVRDKDHQILEFSSFNRACQLVPDEGFRTFFRIDGQVHEPFVRSDRIEVEQALAISAGEVELVENDPRSGLMTSVVYFPLVNLPIAGLVRQVTLRNTSKRPLNLECLDGVPRVLPYGMNQQHIKFTTRHIEAMMGVQYHQGVPLLRLKQSAADRERIDKLSGGNFYLTVQDGRLCEGRFLVDPESLFGDPFQHHTAWSFVHGGLEAVLAARQLTDNATPCAFTALSGRLDPGQSMSWTSVLGNVETEERLEQFLSLATRPEGLADKRKENRNEVERITDMAFTASAAKRFDQYCGQDFLDNVMRGGMPVVFQTGAKRNVFYVYARQNGDLERDYHYFVLEPTYLSQGTGHYRSIYQNRRTDTWFFPEIDDVNIRWFMNLIQLDGYNPLEVQGLTYTVRDREGLAQVLREFVDDEGSLQELLELTSTAFTPGELVMAFERGEKKSPDVYIDFIGRVLSRCEENELGGLHEGFWVDHWLYNLDTIDVYLMVFPDRLRELLVERIDYTFFDDPDIILPRSEKSVLREDGAVRRYGAVVRDSKKLALIASRTEGAYRARTQQGQGDVYRTCLLVKLLSLVANRIATLDPAGVGMEMEADKPGWNDSMNGLPGLFGSSLCETLELQKACQMLDGYLARLGGASVLVYEELAVLIDELEPALEDYRGEAAGALAYWDRANTAKEHYREATKMGVSGVERRMDAARMRQFLSACLSALNPLFDGPRRGEVLNAEGVPLTYFVNEVIEHETTPSTSHQGLPIVRPTRFVQRPVPLFLEGPVHYMKVHPEQAKQVYEAVRASELFDAKLGMYKSCVNMSKESFELGRAVGAYPRGWLENESIYLHMEYKYLLEILRAGLFEEFYNDIKTVLVPFHDPAVYGRSTLEGGSFIVSSSYADASLHGRGYQPRLSGITCEMLHTWILMVAGERPFRIDEEGKLQLVLEPALAEWLFTKHAQRLPYHDPIRGRIDVEVPANSFAFKLLGRTLVIYRNDARRNTWGADGARPVRYAFTFRDGKQRVVEGPGVDADLARAVRDGRVEQVVVALAPSQNGTEG